MAARSYVWPSEVMTGCAISSRVMQQRNSSGTSCSTARLPAPCSLRCTFSVRTRMAPLPSSSVNSQRPEDSSQAVSRPALPLSSGRFARPQSTARVPTAKAGAGPLLLLLLPLQEAAGACADAAAATDSSKGAGCGGHNVCDTTEASPAAAASAASPMSPLAARPVLAGAVVALVVPGAAAHNGVTGTSGTPGAPTARSRAKPLRSLAACPARGRTA
mmetsp:Transcript_71234/g.230644  ORF Transcript_71234/g.230644 Transcript_71234/m.230644 type:complete len:217 (+) Transcript_71234:2092-2742(+)